MVLEGKTRFVKQGTKLVLYIPSDMVKDSMFPFKRGDEVYLIIDADSKDLHAVRIENLPAYKPMAYVKEIIRAKEEEQQVEQ